MSFIFSRAMVEEFSRVNCSGIDAFAPLNLIPTPKPSLLRGKTTEPCRRSRFGMTFGLSTDDLGEELLMSWLADFPARTSAPRATVQALKAHEADSGSKWLGSFAKYDHDSSLWKTAQCSLLGDSEEFSETWPRWGSMRNGECFLRPTAAPITSGKGSGFWPTPTVCGNHNRKGASKTSGDGLATAVKKRGIPTPTASMHKASSIKALTRKDGRDRTYDRLDHFVFATESGPLNPDWVEWLMGWPIGHTDLRALETAKYQEWLRQHSPYSPMNDQEAA
jgi:hypothetical protein